MKKGLIIACFFIAMLAVSTFADFSHDAEILQNRLNQINSFYARFTQRVTDIKNHTVQENSEGELWIKRPNMFRWHMTSPNEIILISDGKTLWFYNPFIKQVTVNWLKSVTGKTPFILIICNSTAEWGQYNVEKQGDSFFLVPKANNSNLKQFTINITPNGTITYFSIVDQNGYHNTFYLKSQKNSPLNDAKFHFTLPKGVTLDDQRQ